MDLNRAVGAPKNRVVGSKISENPVEKYTSWAKIHYNRALARRPVKADRMPNVGSSVVALTSTTSLSNGAGAAGVASAAGGLGSTSLTSKTASAGSFVRNIHPKVALFLDARPFNFVLWWKIRSMGFRTR